MVPSSSLQETGPDEFGETHTEGHKDVKESSKTSSVTIEQVNMTAIRAMLDDPRHILSLSELVSLPRRFKKNKKVIVDLSSKNLNFYSLQLPS